MLDARTLRLLVPRPIRRFPADLAVVVAVAVLACLLPLVPGVRETPLRIMAGLAFVLVLPGYAFTAALFPERGSSDAPDDGGRTLLPRPGDGLDAYERVVLSIGLSVTVVPLLALLLNFTPWGIQFASVLLAVGGFTVATATVGAVRRWQLPADERFRASNAVAVPSLGFGLLASDGRLETAVNVVLALSLLVATVSAVYAVAMPRESEQFTEFYVMTETENGTLVANDYPNGTGGDPVVVGIANREHERSNYTVVVEAQQLSSRNDSDAVAEQRELNRFQATLDHNETWRREHSPNATLTGDAIRVQYLLYRGDAPEDAERSTAYRTAHFWLNASEPSE